MLFIVAILIKKCPVFHLHFVLFKKSEFVMMSLIVLTLVVTGHRGPAGVENTREIQSKNKSVCENAVTGTLYIGPLKAPGNGLLVILKAKFFDRAKSINKKIRKNFHFQSNVQLKHCSHTVSPMGLTFIQCIITNPKFIS